MTDQTDRLLRDAENYLSALHGSVARHDNLAENYACAGCELRDAIRAALAAPAAVVSPPATPAATPSRRAGLRDLIRRAVCEAEGFAWDSDTLEPDEYGEVADTVLAVLYAEWPWLRAEAEDAAPDDGDRRDRYADAIHDAMEADLSLVDQEPGTQALFSRAAEAAVTMADTELAEARTHAAEAEAERAEWETTAYRHANLWRNEQEASRRLLGQRQQMAEERFAWQERGDKAEARVAELEQQQAEQRAAVLREAADIAEEVALKRHQQHEIEREQGALDVMTELHRLADETATTPAEHTPQQPS